ncbi:radical SAM protein [Chloroflexota bacterium]
MQQDKILPPLMVSLAITRECNLKCKHCYSNATDSPHSNELDTTEAKRVITEIAQVGTRLLIFDGGEPLMRDDIYELISHAVDAGLQPMVGTNATRLSIEAAGRMKQAGVKTVAVSLYGADAESHDDFCGREGSWERTMAGIRNVTITGIPLQINTCIHKYNLPQFDDVVTMAKELGAISIEVFSFVTAGRGKENPDLALTTEDQKHLIGQIIQHQLQDQNMVYRCIGIPQYWVEVERMGASKEVMGQFIRSCCGAALRYCCVFYEGTVYPCTVLQKEAGNIREKSFQEIWHDSEVFRKMRDRDKLEGKCHNCIYRQICGGARCIVFEKTGSLTKEDGNCWFKKNELKKKKELKRITTVQETGCTYCGKETIALCQVCQSSICENHGLYCPLCHTQLCHPDVKDCFFNHHCS